MSDILLQHLGALVIGFGVTALLIPQIIAFAHRHQVLDFPGERRRVHRVAVPRLGGVAILAGTVIGAILMLTLGRSAGTPRLPYMQLMPGLAMGVTLVFLTGLMDDLKGVHPRGKLVAQVLAALCLVAFGFGIDTVALSRSGGSLSLGVFSIPITVLWLVGTTNAFNLIDGADGLAGTFTLIGLTAAIGVDLYLHDAQSMVVPVAMMGAVFAFLRFNNHPARIFLGDAGSMTLGFYLAARLVVASTSADGRTFVLVPLFALAFPLVDTAIAIARRWLAGHPLSRADGRHIHHQVLALGISTRLTVDLLGLFFSGVAALGLSISFAPPELTLAFMVVTSILLFAGFFYGSRWLKYGEFAELGRSFRSVILHARTVVREKIRASEVALALRSAKTFDEVRRLLDGMASDVRLLDIELIAGDLRAGTPERRRIWPADQLPIHLDYPFVWHSEEGIRQVTLRLWSVRPGRGVHPTVERIATRLGPALEDWFRRNSRELTPVFGMESQQASTLDAVRVAGGRTRLGAL